MSDEGDFGMSGFSLPNMGSYFRGAYDTLTDYAPLPYFGSDDDEDGDENDDNDDDEYDEDDDTSKIRKPKLKNSLYSKHRKPPNSLYSDVQEKNNNRWYDKFFFGSDDEATTTTASSMPLKTATDSGFFSWFASSEESTEKPVNLETATTKQSTVFYIKLK